MAMSEGETSASFRSRSKQLAKRVLVHSGFLNLLSRLARSDVVVLNYHSIQDEPKSSNDFFVPGIVHSASMFHQQMDLLARRYNPVGMDDVLRYLNGEAKLPARPVAVTFDDGFADNYENAAPILKKFGIPAMFNVVVESIESQTPPWFCRLRKAFARTEVTSWWDSQENCRRAMKEPTDRTAAFLAASARCAKSTGSVQAEIISSLEKELEVEPLRSKECPMMTWAQLRCLRNSGNLIGSHTLSHPNVAYIDEQLQWKEISESKRQLEARLGCCVEFFSYPNPILRPNFNEQTILLTQKAGYKLAVVSVQGSVRDNHNRMAVSRIQVPSNLPEFVWCIDNTRLGRKL
jgi:peptidoglycan/xylan/chitin deacetylase (PgdA/CDA1 family)